MTPSRQRLLLMSPAVPKTAQARLVHAPILRASQQGIRALAARRSTSLSHYQDAIERDPAMALNLFLDVNRSLKRAGRMPVGDIQRAILFAGIAQVPEMLTRASVLEDLAQPPLLEELTQLLSYAHHSAYQARYLSAFTPGLNGEEMLATALARASTDYLELLNESSDVSFDYHAIQDLMPRPTAGHDTLAASETCFDLATRFARLTQSTWSAEKLAGLHEKIAEFTGRDAKDVAKSMRLTTLEAARNSGPFGCYPAALNLMTEPTAEVVGIKPKRADKKLATETPGAAQRRSVPIAKKVKNKKPAQATPAPASLPDSAKTSRPADNKNTTGRAARTEPASKAPAVKSKPPSIRRVSQAQGADSDPLGPLLSQFQPTAGDKQAVAALLQRGLAAICTHTALRFAVMLSPGAGDETLRITAHHGMTMSDALLSIEIPLSRNPLLSKILGRAAAFHWQPLKHGDKLHGMPLKLMGDKPGFLYSIVVDNNPVGVILACRPRSAALAASDFETFKRICAAIKAAL